MIKFGVYHIVPMAGYSIATGKEEVSFDVVLNSRDIATFSTMEDAKEAIRTNAAVLHYGARL